MIRWILAPLVALCVVSFNALLCLSQALGTFIPVNVPLGIRSPYFNCWVNRPASNNWPNFWNSQVSTIRTRTLTRLIL